ncbi:cysteine hydrolase family protein [Afipia felis]|jgi:nicotinamidase-related amidase|nr:isochorismatase family cysteine hydrolase [Afipia felis]
MGSLRGAIGGQSVHLCIDMQRLFAPGGPWMTPWLERVLPVVTTLVARQPRRTVFTRFIPAKSPSDAFGTWRAYYEKWRDVTLEAVDPALIDLVPELQTFVPPATQFDRPTYSAFADGRLHAWLQDRRVTTLIVSGSETDVCVLSTVLVAVDHGYRTIVVSDALASSSDESHDALLDLYNRRFDIQIELASAEEVIKTWAIPV